MVDAKDIDFFANGPCTHCHEAKDNFIEFKVFHHEIEHLWNQKYEALEKVIEEKLVEFPEQSGR